MPKVSNRCPKISSPTTTTHLPSPPPCPIPTHLGSVPAALKQQHRARSTRHSEQGKQQQSGVMSNHSYTILQLLLPDHPATTPPVPPLVAVHNPWASGPIPAEFGSMSFLVQARLYSNHISGTIPIELGSLRTLAELYIHNNDLSGPIPAQLGCLGALEIFSVANNRMSGAIPASLGSLKALTNLRLPSNQLSGSIPSELGSLQNLRELELHENRLSRESQKSLGDSATYCF